MLFVYKVEVYKPNRGRGVPVDSDSPAPEPLNVFIPVYEFGNLPEKHLKKYQRAAKYVPLFISLYVRKPV